MEKKRMSSYLSSLKFDPKLKNSFQAKYLVNFRLVVLFIVLIIALGISNFFAIPRRLNPEVKIPIVIVNTVLPGSNPDDVESLLTIPLEDKLKSLEGIDTLTSTSTEGVSSITMQFLSNIDGDKARDDAQSLVDTVSLPEDATDPVVQKLDFEGEAIWSFVVKGKSDIPSLMKFSKILKDRVENLQKVDRVTTTGFNEQEIQIIMDTVKMKEFNITPIQLSQAISRATSAYPAGTVTTGSSTIAMSIDQQVTSIEDIRNIHIGVDGQIVKLSNIATVVETAKLNQQSSYYAKRNGPVQEVVQFSIFKTSSSNIDAAEKDAKKVVDDTIKEYNNQFEVVSIVNYAEEVTKQFSDLLHEFRSTIILVFINLFLFLGLRQAFISSLTIPLTFLATVAIMNIVGLSLNFLTMFAFLIALGLLIDDTIVSVAAMTRYYSTGKFTPAETGVLVWKDFIVPLWSTTITTVWAFVPLLLATGIIGEFIKSIPIVVTATMLSSTTIAVFITIPLMIVILKPNLPYRVKVLLRVLAFLVAAIFVYILLPKSALLPILILVLLIFVYVFIKTRTTLFNKIGGYTDRFSWKRPVMKKAQNAMDHGLINIEPLSYKYMNVINRILGSTSARRNTIIAIVIFAVVAYMLVPLGFVVNEFFPKDDQDIVYISVELPSGTNVSTTRVESEKLLNEIKDYRYADFIVAQTGTAAPTGLGGGGGNSNIFLITMHLVPKAERISSTEVSEQLRNQYSSYSPGKLSIVEVSGGPPAGADVQIKLLGEDLHVLDQNSDKLVAFLEKQNTVTNIEKSIKSGTSKLVFVPDELKLLDAGLSLDSVSSVLRTYASGFTLDTIKMNGDDADIILKMSSTNITPEELGSISIPVVGGAPSGAPGSTSTTPSAVPLISLGSFKLETNPTTITREDGKRTVSVAAAIKKGFSTTTENQKLLTYANSLNLPDGYSIATGGVNEENEKSIQSIFTAMILSMMLILITMVIEFKSFRQALITILTIPLAIPGVFYIFALTGTPLSFPALIGILALFGIVVTNAIVVVEKINDNRKEGMPLREAIVDAAGSRLEPILLTSVTSILGLIPITLSDPLWRGLGGAIISGLLFSGIVKLFFVPIVYYTWYKSDEVNEKKVAHK